MKKALLYTLLFVLLTIAVFFAVMFVVPFFFWNGVDGSVQADSFLDRYPLLLPSVSVILWALITMYIFIKNRYCNIGFGNLAVRDRALMIITGGVAIALMKIALQPLMWMMDNEITDSNYKVIQLWMDSDVLVFVLLAIIHLTLETVCFSAVLHELIIWSRRPVISVLLLAFACTLPGMREISATALAPFICAYLPLAYGGWLYYKTGSIYPSLLGFVMFDFVLLFTPLLNYITVAVVAALTLPWLVIFIYKKLSRDVEPVI